MKKAYRGCILIFLAFFCFSCSATMKPAYVEVPYPRPPGYDISTLWNRAEQLEREGKNQEAADLYYRIATTYPNSEFAPEGFYKIAKLMMKEGKPKDAELYYAYIIEKYPKWPNLYLVYPDFSEAFMKQGKFRDSLAVASRIRENYKKNLYLGVGYWLYGDRNKALAYLENFSRSSELRNPQKAIESINFLSRSLDNQSFNNLLSLNTSQDLNLILRASYGKKLIDGKNPEGRVILNKIFSGINENHFLREPLRQIMGVVAPTEVVQERREPMNIIVTEPGNPKKIGLLVPITGTYGGYGYQVVRGANLAISLWNEANPSDPVELVVQDTPNDPQGVVKAFEKVVNEDKVIAVVGPMSKAGVDALVSGRDQLPLLMVSLVPEDGSAKAFPFHIRFLPSSSSITEKLVDYCVHHLGYKNFATLYPEDSFGKQTAETFRRAVESKGGKVLVEVGYNPKTTDFGSYIEKLMVRGNSKIDKPDFQALFLPDELKTVSLIGAQLYYHNVVGVTLLGSHLWDNPKLETISSGYLDGAYYVTSYFHNQESQEYLVFKSRFMETYKTTPQFLEAVGYDAVNMVLKIRSMSEKSRAGLIAIASRGFSYGGSITGVNRILPDGLIERSHMIINIRGTTPMVVSKY